MRRLSSNKVIERAIEIAARQHRGQVDKGGTAYILHPLRVMLAARTAGGTIEQQAAAVLHDVVEDTPMTLNTLARLMPKAVVDYVRVLTRAEDYPYALYLLRIAQTPGASLVKRADLLDNRSRLGELRDKETRDRLEAKYSQALRFLASFGDGPYWVNELGQDPADVTEEGLANVLAFASEARVRGRSEEEIGNWILRGGHRTAGRPWDAPAGS